MASIDPIKYEPRPFHRKTPRWYHSHIIDWMMANPSGKLEDCATFVGKSPNTISAIIRSDMFQAALAKRKSEYATRQDLVLSTKLTEVAVASLDTILKVIEKKKDALPLETLSRVSEGALERLGYGVRPSGPAVSIQNNVQVNSPVSAGELNEARQLLRQNQQLIASSQNQTPTPVLGSSGQTNGETAAGSAPSSQLELDPIDAVLLPLEEGAAPVERAEEGESVAPIIPRS